MVLTDFNLFEVLARLSDQEQKAVASHLAGNPTPESWAAIRMLRRSLKRKVRSNQRRQPTKKKKGSPPQ